MSVWNYIGEFLLFRWLFGNRNRSHNVGSSHHFDATDNAPRRVDIEDYIANNLDDDLRAMSRQTPRYSSRRPYQSADIYDDEDYALDNYDPTDNDNTSFNDFLDEQDDYDIMNDDF